MHVQVSYWIATEIVMATVLKDRVNILKKFIQVAEVRRAFSARFLSVPIFIFLTASARYGQLQRFDGDRRWHEHLVRHTIEGDLGGAFARSLEGIYAKKILTCPVCAATPSRSSKIGGRYQSAHGKQAELQELPPNPQDRSPTAYPLCRYVSFVGTECPRTYVSPPS